MSYPYLIVSEIHEGIINNFWVSNYGAISSPDQIGNSPHFQQQKQSTWPGPLAITRLFSAMYSKHGFGCRPSIQFSLKFSKHVNSGL